CIYKRSILQAPRLGCLNVHHGLLPRYRGTMCDLYALSEGREAGFSVHVMTPKLDAGPILRRQIVGGGTRDYLSYLRHTGPIEARVLTELVDEIENLGQLPTGDVNRCDDM